ncbi:MAG: hypothetical protein MZV64_54030 [Ignavibacteriales bacterium]|nr:hypothetical protein [Ignavibacteriales bacterium]
MQDLEEKAYKIGASFLYKNSPRLVARPSRVYASDHFGFGDFVFVNNRWTAVGQSSKFI